MIVAYRRRGAVTWSHRFRVEPWQWAGFYRHCRVNRQTSEYARVGVRGEMLGVL